MESLTRISKEPKVAKNAVDLVSRVNPRFHYPKDLKHLERSLRISLALPIKGKYTSQVPYAYEYDAATDTYSPNMEVFKLLWQARRYLYTSSLREVTDWLNLKASKLNYNVNITHMGLRNVIIMRPPYEECLLPTEEKEKIIESLVVWTKLNQ